MQAKNLTLENDNIINYYKLLQLNFNADFKIWGKKNLPGVKKKHPTKFHVLYNCFSDKLGIMWNKVCKTHHEVTYNCVR